MTRYLNNPSLLPSPEAESRPEEPASADPATIVRDLAAARDWPEVEFEEIKALYRGHPPLEKIEDLCPNEELALTLDKSFQLLDRFLTGEIYAKKEVYEKAAEMTANPVFKAKWARQAELLSRAVPRVGLDDITFGLRMKWLPPKYIAEFLRDSGFNVSLRDRVFTLWGQADLFAGYLQDYLNGQSWKSRQAGSRDRLEELEESFNKWLHQHPDILELTELYNRHFNSHIEPVYTASHLDLGGIFSGRIILHPYQNSEVRRLLDAGRGLCSFEVGLGKTYIALALAALALITGRFKRVCFVVPAAVLGHWRREAELLFTVRYVEDNFFFVRTGPRAARDLCRAAVNGRPFVVMSKESFGSLSLETATREEFVRHASIFCPAMESTFRREIIEAPQAVDRPFFENFGFESLLLDEVHIFKNSFEASSAHKKIVHLSTPPFSKTALNAAVKAFHVRAKKGGVYGLTATPLTNSPFEIFNMLSLVCDLKEFATLGVETIDDIIEVFGRVKTIGHVKISGKIQQRQGLLGFVNLHGLRNIFHRHVKLKSLEEADDLFSRPEKFEHEELVRLAGPQAASYEKLRQRALKLEAGARKDLEAREAIFAIIRDMDRLTVDLDLYERMTTYLFRPEKAAEVDHLLALLPVSCLWAEYDESEAAWKMVEKNLEPCLNRSSEGLIVLRLPETLDRGVAEYCRQVGLDESDLTHPLNPKYARLIDLAGAYLEAGGNQLVFTEEKGEHAKLRRLLAWNLKLPLDRIGVINADEAAGGRLDRLLRDYREGHLRLVVANRKAELGLNLQTGTTAIHHLSLPWTPASLYQRNGRGLRQGNQEKEIHIHYYVGEKTFDSYRRTILEAKAGWINELLNGQMPTIGHNLELSLEEQLDLLAATPEEAEARREKRRQAAEMERRKQKRDGLFNSLRQLTWLAAKNSQSDQRLAEKIKKTELKTQKLAIALGHLETGARSPANARRDYLNYINDEIKESQKLRTGREKFRENTCMRGAGTYAAEGNAVEEVESFWVESAGRIAALQNLKTAPEMSNWVPRALEFYAGDLARNQVLAAQLETRRSQKQARDKASLEQTRNYLRRVQETEGLPFPMELLEQLESFLVTPKNKILRFGQFYLLAGQGLKIISTHPGTRQAVVNIFDPAAGKTWRRLKLESLEGCREATLDEFLLSRVWCYGQVLNLGLIDREFWDCHARWLQFDLAFGAVYRLENRFIPVWNQDCPIPPGALPAWPEPEDAEFRRQVFREYLEVKDQGNPRLMAALFGEGYEALAWSFEQDREGNGDWGGLWEKMRQTLGQANDEELIKKIQDLLKIKSRQPHQD